MIEAVQKWEFFNSLLVDCDIENYEFNNLHAPLLTRRGKETMASGTRVPSQKLLPWTGEAGWGRYKIEMS
jgi:hypothetical protein